jgi:hypothetical protein
MVRVVSEFTYYLLRVVSELKRARGACFVLHSTRPPAVERASASMGGGAGEGGRSKLFTMTFVGTT